jgi:hypothetical protein
MTSTTPVSERTALITAVFERDSERARQRGCDADTAVWETARQAARERAHELIATANARRRATSESVCIR